MAGPQATLRPSLEFRLSAWVSALLLGVAIVAGVFSFVAACEEANELQDDTLRQIGALIERNHLPVGNAITGLPDLDSDPESRVVVQLLANANGEAVGRPSATPLLSAALPDGLQTVMVEGESWRLFVTTLATDTRFLVGQQTELRDEIARDGAFRSLLPFVILIPILLVVLRCVIRRMLNPLNRLASDLDGRNEQDLGTLSASGLPTEIRPFVVAINRLLARVEQSVSRQRRFVADASHELRSPLTALSLQAERLADTRMSSVAGDRVAALRQGICRARLLLDQLLTLTRVQEPSAMAVSPVSLEQIFRQILEDLHPRAAAKSIDIEVTGEQGASIILAESDLITLLRNLVDNAIKYTPAGGRIDLSVGVDDRGVVVEVSDNGPGIAPSERALVFEPFHRVLGNDEAGSGLGLSIVKAITDRYAASVALDYTDVAQSCGLRVTVSFRGSERNAGTITQR
ncbi:MAG: Sensor protein QseC [Candidatus Accumulibacter appositus]|uniref:histidine kinase n=1 Tax=Candidatus Accumulibacter appositus TaxID=1454003 RepID=A0A011NC05_9PROT|nr:MAG: Sensor protein QseC [Candidatus Accumulibacter appositus]